MQNNVKPAYVESLPPLDDPATYVGHGGDTCVTLGSAHASDADLMWSGSNRNAVGQQHTPPLPRSLAPSLPRSIP